jgi:glycosyltransferase involved in cell wall biosynthesis
MRILYFADIRFPLERANGIQTMETCHALACREHDVTLVVRPDSRDPPRDPFEFYGIRPTAQLSIERAPGPRHPILASRVAYLSYALARASGPSHADVILTRDLGVASVLCRLPRAMRPPLVYESHGYAPDVASALPDLVATAQAPTTSKIERLTRREARVWRTAEGYVTITRGLASELAARFGSRPRLAVVADGTRVGGPAPCSIKQPGEPLTVGYAGHLYAWKGVDVLLAALAQVPEVRGFIVGGHDREPDLGRLRQLADRLGLGSRVTFAGLVPPPRVPELLATADILVLPNPASAISTRFTSPLKLFEYMAAGRAIVASDLPAIREVIDQEVHALLVPAGDAIALASAIRRLLADTRLRDSLARAARARVADYTWDRRAQRLEVLLAEVTGTSQ